MSTQKLRESLLTLRGIGPATADDILLYAFERLVFVIDVYTHRLLWRLNVMSRGEKYEVLQLLFENNLPRKVDLYKQSHALIITHAKQCR